jgi:hypothetical protein
LQRKGSKHHKNIRKCYIYNKSFRSKLSNFRLCFSIFAMILEFAL